MVAEFQQTNLHMGKKDANWYLMVGLGDSLLSDTTVDHPQILAPGKSPNQDKLVRKEHKNRETYYLVLSAPNEGTSQLTCIQKKNFLSSVLNFNI